MDLKTPQLAIPPFSARIDFIELELPHRYMSRASRRPFQQLQCKAVFPRTDGWRKVRLVAPTTTDMKTLRKRFPHMVLSKLGVALALQDNFRVLDRRWGLTESVYCTSPTGWRSSCLPIDKAESLRVVYDGPDEVEGGFLEIGSFSLSSKFLYCIEDLFDVQLARGLAHSFKPLWSVARDGGDGANELAAGRVHQALTSLFLGFALPDGAVDDVQPTFDIESMMLQLVGS
ncbi:hypothetical protein [Acidovorax sp.]|uniref:hypothetical protein n=1 Tax=Acidovorax sp. TaxID=1872122 RepID=UPI003D0699F2